MYYSNTLPNVSYIWGTPIPKKNKMSDGIRVLDFDTDFIH